MSQTKLLEKVFMLHFIVLFALASKIKSTTLHILHGGIKEIALVHLLIIKSYGGFYLSLDFVFYFVEMNVILT